MEGTDREKFCCDAPISVSIDVVPECTFGVGEWKGSAFAVLAL